MTFFYAIVGLGVLIFVHELGHFSVSLALGMRPRRFYLGFPPAIVSIKRRGIEYGIGAIPLGGFVKIPGMHRPSGVDVDAAFGLTREEVPQVGVMVDRLRAAISDGNEETALDLLGTIERELESRPLSTGAQKSATRGLEDLRDALGTDAYWRAATWKRVAAIAAGPAANILLAVVLFTVLFMTSGKPLPMVKTVGAGTPAAKIGLQSGDRILGIDSRALNVEGISRAITSSNGKPLVLTVVRGDRVVIVGPVSPTRRDGYYRLGFTFAGEGLPPLTAIGKSVRLTGLVTRDIGGSLGRLAHGEGNEVSSPVGIVQGSSNAAKQGATSFLFVLGLISLSIALLNLLPLLPLDGGHIVFAIAEGLRGRTIRREVYERVSAVGIGLVVLLFVIGLSNDITRLS